MSESEIKIRMLQNVRPDFPFGIIGLLGEKPGTILRAGMVYPAKSNGNGAISGLCENGEYLGVKPGEFEFIDAPEWVLEIHGAKVNEKKRDLAVDLAICEATTAKGPVKWQKFGYEYYLTGQYGMRPIILGTVPVEKEGCREQIHISNRDPERDLLIPLNPLHPDSRFIEQAWEGWPYAIRRAMAAEAEVEQLKKELRLCGRRF